MLPIYSAGVLFLCYLHIEQVFCLDAPYIRIMQVLCLDAANIQCWCFVLMVFTCSAGALSCCLHIVQVLS